MKKQFILLVGLFVLFSVASLVYSLCMPRVFGQTSLGTERPRITKTASTARSEASNSKAFVAAAATNASSVGRLAWPFAGRSQIGWAIYVPLIAHTIGAEPDAGTAEFAANLSYWQEVKGLPATGVIDADTMQAFAGFWQSQRLGKNAPAANRELLSAPITDFWDAGRDPTMLQLERNTYAAYRRLIAAAAKDLGKVLKFSSNGELAPGEKFLRIVSAYRSPEYQAALRKREPNAGGIALAKNSPHFTGHALDIYVGGEPVTTKDPNRLIQVQTPAYRWLVKNASKFGFYPYFYEPWHWEYVPGR
ncbi:MAG: D-alanyl-D-alanine carboxypeptidase family protein [Pyrinomonadaceae bacterium]